MRPLDLPFRVLLASLLTALCLASIRDATGAHTLTYVLRTFLAS
jgi:hypothetical protein